MRGMATARGLALLAAALAAAHGASAGVLAAALAAAHGASAGVAPHGCPVRPYALSSVFIEEGTQHAPFTWKLQASGARVEEEEEPVLTGAHHVQVLSPTGAVLHDSGMVEPRGAGARAAARPPADLALAQGEALKQLDASGLGRGSLAPAAWAALPRAIPLSLRVRIACGSGAWSPWSAPAPLHVTPVGGPFGAAQWVCTSPAASNDIRASMLRTEFSLPPPSPGATLAGATLYIIGLGQFVARINGGAVGGEANAPPWSTWQKRLYYSAYTLAPGTLSTTAPNALAVHLGNGFYNVIAPPQGRYTKFVGAPATRMALVRLVATWSDGSTSEVVSGAGGGWAATDGGPVSYTHEYAGEDFNGTLAVPGWDAPGFNPASNPLVAWTPAASCASAAPAANATLQATTWETVQVMAELPAVSIVPSSTPGTMLVDMGRNFAGYARVSLAAVPPGAIVRVWPSETMYNGAIDQSSGGTPTFWQYFVPPTAPAPVDVTFAPVFNSYGWRWLAVQLLNVSAPVEAHDFALHHHYPPPGAPPVIPVPRGRNARMAAPPGANGTLTVVSATWGANCNAALKGDETAAVAAWCGAGQGSCTFQVCACGDNTCPPSAPPCLPDPAANCAKDFTAVWTCSGDPPGAPPRACYLPAEADNSAVTLACGALPPACAAPPPPPVLPNVTAAVGFFTRAALASVGVWSSSNEWVNRIHNITLEASYADTQSVNPDCPHRERLGWLEVSHLMAPSFAFNMGIAKLWAKISHDTVDSQLPNGMVPDIAPEYTVFSGGFRDSPEWGSASILNPFWLGALYGDVATTAATYPTGVAYVNYLLSRRDPGTGLLTEGLGDWNPVEASPAGVTGTAILVQDLRALATAATALGLPAAAANFTALAANVSAAYQAAFWNGSAYPTQCAAGAALTLGLVPEAEAPAAAAFLRGDIVARGNVMTSGEIGNRYALMAMGAMGAEGIAVVWDSLLRNTTPGYGIMLVMGETALAETWDDSPGASHIHAMYGHIDEFLYTYVAGLQQAPGSVAWRSARLAPALLPGLDWLDVSYDSPAGVYRVAYNVTPDAGGSGGGVDVELRVTAPPGVAATAVLPLSGREVRVPATGLAATFREHAGVDPRRRRG
jgi:hypothetical protein